VLTCNISANVIWLFKHDFTRTAFYVPPLLARLASAALSLCVYSLRVRQTSVWLIALLVSGWLIFQGCCLRPVALLLARCRCVSPCCLLIFCFPKYGPICLCCLPPHLFSGPERMGGLGRRRRCVERENYPWLIGNLRACDVWRITKVMVSVFLWLSSQCPH